MSQDIDNYYQILGVSQDASIEEIGQVPATLQNKEASLVLSSPKWQSRYDALRNIQARDENGLLIPPEYPLTFNRKGLCWPGFFLSVFWAYSKGLPTARSYLLGWLFALGWLGGLWCLFAGYREYSAFLNQQTPEKVVNNQRLGLWCIYRIIIALIAWWLLRVVIAVAQ